MLLLENQVIFVSVTIQAILAVNRFSPFQVETLVQHSINDLALIFVK